MSDLTGDSDGGRARTGRENYRGKMSGSTNTIVSARKILVHVTTHAWRCTLQSAPPLPGTLPCINRNLEMRMQRACKDSCNFAYASTHASVPFYCASALEVFCYLQSRNRTKKSPDFCAPPRVLQLFCE